MISHNKYHTCLAVGWTTAAPFNCEILWLIPFSILSSWRTLLLFCISISWFLVCNIRSRFILALPNLHIFCDMEVSLVVLRTGAQLLVSGICCWFCAVAIRIGVATCNKDVKLFVESTELIFFFMFLVFLRLFMGGTSDILLPCWHCLQRTNATRLVNVGWKNRLKILVTEAGACLLLKTKISQPMKIQQTASY